MNHDFLHQHPQYMIQDFKGRFFAIRYTEVYTYLWNMDSKKLGWDDEIETRTDDDTKGKKW